MQCGCDSPDTFGPLLGGLFTQLQFENLSVGEQAQRLTAVLHLIPIRIVIGTEAIAFGKSLAVGGLADPIHGLDFLQGFIAKH